MTCRLVAKSSSLARMEASMDYRTVRRLCSISALHEKRARAKLGLLRSPRAAEAFSIGTASSVASLYGPTCYSPKYRDLKGESHPFRTINLNFEVLDLRV